MEDLRNAFGVFVDKLFAFSGINQKHVRKYFVQTCQKLALHFVYSISLIAPISAVGLNRLKQNSIELGNLLESNLTISELASIRPV